MLVYCLYRALVLSDTAGRVVIRRHVDPRSLFNKTPGGQMSWGAARFWLLKGGVPSPCD